MGHRVFAVEPMSANAHLLRRSLALLGRGGQGGSRVGSASLGGGRVCGRAGNVTVLQVAAAERDGEDALFMAPHNAGDSRVGKWTNVG